MSHPVPSFQLGILLRFFSATPSPRRPVWVGLAEDLRGLLTPGLVRLKVVTQKCRELRAFQVMVIM